jgi:putative chitinase
MRLAFVMLLLVPGAEPAKENEKPQPLTLAQLRDVMPHLPKERAEAYLEPLNKALAEYDVGTPKRRAAFLAQLAHESGELRFMEEIASGEAYEGRKDLGNTQPGDGKRYKGRGPIQLTGRGNYRRAGKVLGLELEEHPEEAAKPEVGFRVAGWFWKTHGLNELADQGDFRQITRRINGGYNGLKSREKYYQRALEVLGVAP